MTDDKDYNYLFKIVLIGNNGVGKSSILYRFSEDKWEEKLIPITNRESFDGLNSWLIEIEKNRIKDV